MKKVFAVFALLAAIVCVAWVGMSAGSTAHTEYLRVHIRANSNSEEDQTVKYRVRDAVVEYLTPALAECQSKEAAYAAVENRLLEISKIAEEVLEGNGYFYGARAGLRREEFPTRVYGDRTLEAGVYDALIVELGSGEGDNWWCVVYPPLCFTAGNGNIVYKSKIAEIIKKFFQS